MLTLESLTIRIGARVLLDQAGAVIAQGWKVGLIGRNGAGKSTLLTAIREAIDRGNDPSIRLARGARLGFVAQEAEATPEPLLSVVLAADRERAALLREAETATDPDRIAEIHTRLYDIDAHSAEARAGSILLGLGFTSSDLGRAMKEFSGGWRMRAALAGVLFAQPDLLLLDEPTNYLDLEGAAWLEVYLRKYPHTVIMVSHDREMLNRSVTHILALEHAKLSLHPGGYDTYLRKRAEQLALAQSMKARQDADRARLQAFVERFRAKASKARQAQSRVKMLERMTEISVPLTERTTPFRFEVGEQLASPLLQLEEAELGYAPGRPVLTRVSLRVDHDDRIAIVGSNGQGKTTLVKSIAARLPLLAGQRRAPGKLRIGYFSQDQMDELDGALSALDQVRRLMPDAGEAARRARAAAMGFGPEKIETPAQRLSGGEKVRLLLGLAAFARPHILILDEPTSHLDIDSREALIHALNEFEGAMLLITHDVYLAEACAERLWLVRDGRASAYQGDLDDYRKLVLAADRPAGGSRVKSVSSPSAGSQGATAVRPATDGGAQPDARPSPAKPGVRANPSQLRKRLGAAEAAITAAQDRIASIDRRLSDPAMFAADPRQAAALAAERSDLETVLAHAEGEWLAAAEALDAAG